MAAVRRRLSNLLTVFSSLLCVAASAGWAASYYGAAREGMGFETGNRRVVLYRGDLWLDHYLQDHAPRSDYDWGWNCADLVAYRHFWGRHEEWTPSLLRLLPVAAMTALLPAARLGTTWLRRRTPPPGSCRRCGYDLRATPAMCPECGATPAPAPNTAPAL
jgi:hypothetical protein